MTHLPAIGAERLKRLREAGINSWSELRRQPPSLLNLNANRWGCVCRELDKCERALKDKDLTYLMSVFHASDYWRVLASFFPDLTFFDIETDGLSWDSTITVIVCRHGDQFYRFVNGENLEEFLDFLDGVQLLVSFNGNSFDVPFVLRTFNIPDLPCPHLDLRWVCYHEGLRGGLKRIEQRLGILRPPELIGVDGAEAVQLWLQWQSAGTPEARSLLLRYCCADVAALELVAAEILKQRGCWEQVNSSDQIWQQVSRIVDDEEGEDHQDDNQHSFDYSESERESEGDTNPDQTSGLKDRLRKYYRSR